MRRLAALSLLAAMLTACGSDPLPASREVLYAQPVPTLDSLPEVKITSLDTVLKARRQQGDTLPQEAENLASVLPATLVGFYEPEVKDAQMLDMAVGRLSMAKTLFFDENDHYMEVTLYDLNGQPAMVASLVEEYRSADGTELNGSHYSRLPVMPKGRIGFIRKEEETLTATVLAGFRYQLTLETDAPCETDCFMQVVIAVKWDRLK